MLPRSVLTSVVLLTCAAFSAIPRNAPGQATSSPSPTASPSATATATATATPTPTPATRLGNIATRSLVDVGDNALIAGFTITGTQSKKVLVRGIAPSLRPPDQPHDDHLDDPTLELRDATGKLIQSNDNWNDSADKAAIFNTRLPPANDLEAAIIATLPANGASYTAILRGANGGTGIGVVEVYDLDSSTADSKLANISTRGLVLNGDNVMIAGTIVVGPGPQEVIIRALGPSLPLPNKLADPKLELYNANGVLLDANDNWGDRPKSEKDSFFDKGLAPIDPRESAIKMPLSANNSNYTVVVRDAGQGQSSNNISSPTITRTQHGSGNTLEIQRVEFARAPVGGPLRLTFMRPSIIMSGQPGDKAALKDRIIIPGAGTADQIKAAILGSSGFFKYDQNNNLTAGPKGFHDLFDSGGGLGIEGNEGSRREPVITRSSTDLSNFTIQFGTLTTGNVGIRNPWISGLPLVQVDDSSIIYNGGIAVVEIYAIE